MHGTSGALTKLLALPVFCTVVILTRWLSYKLPDFGLPVLRTMLVFKTLLLAAGAAIAVRPFSDGDSGLAMLAGMALVRMSGSVAVFAAGCAAAALSFTLVNIWCLVIPPVLAACAVALQHSTREGEVAGPVVVGR